MVASRCFPYRTISLAPEQTLKDLKNPRDTAWRWGEWIWLTRPSRFHRNLPQGLNISFIRVFDQIRDLEIPITLCPRWNIVYQIRPTFLIREYWGIIKIYLTRLNTLHDFYFELFRIKCLWLWFFSLCSPPVAKRIRIIYDMRIKLHPDERGWFWIIKREKFYPDGWQY